MQDAEDYLFELTDEELAGLLKGTKLNSIQLDYPKPESIFPDTNTTFPTAQEVSDLAKSLAQPLPVNPNFPKG